MDYYTETSFFLVKNILKMNYFHEICLISFREYFFFNVFHFLLNVKRMMGFIDGITIIFMGTENPNKQSISIRIND